MRGAFEAVEGLKGPLNSSLCFVTRVSSHPVESGVKEDVALGAPGDFLRAVWTAVVLTPLFTVRLDASVGWPTMVSKGSFEPTIVSNSPRTSSRADQSAVKPAHSK